MTIRSHGVEASTPEGLRAEPVSRWLRALDPRLQEPFRFERIGAGQSNLTFEARDAAGRRLVVRRPPLGDLLASAHDVVREARILAALQASSVKVPQVLGVETDEAMTGAPIVAMEHVSGLVLHSADAATQVSIGQRGALSMSMVETLAAVHAIDLSAVGLADLASRTPYAERQLRRWSRQLEGSTTRPRPLLEDLAQRLRVAVPAQTQTSLVHGDFHIGNVIVDAESGQVAAVLDWELSTLGDPLADVGTMLAYWTDPDDVGGGTGEVTSLPGFAPRDELVREYLRLTGHDGSALPFWNVLALWKIAVIVEGIAQRTASDARNRAAAGSPGDGVVERLVARADQLARRAGF